MTTAAVSVLRLSVPTPPVREASHGDSPSTRSHASAAEGFYTRRAGVRHFESMSAGLENASGAVHCENSSLE